MTFECEFCESHIASDQPENVALLTHVATSPDCNEQFEFMLENLRKSWTVSMSGG